MMMEQATILDNWNDEPWQVVHTGVGFGALPGTVLYPKRI